MVKAWNQCFEFFQTHKRNGAESSQKSITSLIKMINLLLSFPICLAISLMKLRILLSPFHGRIKRYKTKWAIFNSYFNKMPKRRIYIFTERLFTILLKAGRWKWWQFLQMKESLMKERQCLQMLSLKGSFLMPLKILLEGRLNLFRRKR